jgi:hypothetical protein
MKLQDLFDEVSNRLVAERAEQIQELLDVGEEGVALEILVDDVIDFDLVVTQEFKDSARGFAEAMELAGNRWEYLRRQIRTA